MSSNVVFQRERVPVIRRINLGGHDHLGRKIDRVFGLVRQMRPAVLHLRDAAVFVGRTLPLVVRDLDHRQRRMNGRLFGRRHPQELPQRQRITAPPGDSPLRPDPLEVADQQHAEVDARRNARPAPLRVVRLAQLLDPLVEAPCGQQFIELHVESMSRRDRQARCRDPQFPLPLVVPSPQRHRFVLAPWSTSSDPPPMIATRCFGEESPRGLF